MYENANLLNVTSAQYEADLDDDSVDVAIIAVIDGVKMSIPLDPENRHYRELKRRHDDSGDSFTIAASS